MTSNKDSNVISSNISNSYNNYKCYMNNSGSECLDDSIRSAQNSKIPISKNKTSDKANLYNEKCEQFKLIKIHAHRYNDMQTQKTVLEQMNGEFKCKKYENRNSNPVLLLGNDVKPTSKKEAHKAKSKSFLINPNTNLKSTSSKFSSSNQLAASKKNYILNTTNLFLNNHESGKVKQEHATISAAKSKDVNNISLAPSSSTCYINNPKKKRSSLFNLFSFKSSTSQLNLNSKSDTPQTKNKNCSTPVDDKNDLEVEQKSPSTFISNDLSDSEQNRSLIDLSNEELLLMQSSPPPPVEFSDSNEDRPRSIVKIKNPLYHSYIRPKRTTSSPTRNKNSRYYSNNSDDNSEHLTISNDSNFESDLSSIISVHSKNTNNSNRSVSPISSNRSSTIINETDMSTLTTSHNVSINNSVVDKRHLNKKPSIRSRGFSIPLNASFCLNPMPVDLLQHLSANNTLNNINSKDLSFSKNEELSDNNNAINPTKNNNNSNNKNDESDACILFPINSFDLKEGNSCLKEVNLRLKFAEIKHLEDEFSEERLQEEESNNLRCSNSSNSTTQFVENSNPKLSLTRNSNYSKQKIYDEDKDFARNLNQVKFYLFLYFYSNVSMMIETIHDK